eukprot:scaffold36375_cov35-Attheya_sp.AAC.1
MNKEAATFAASFALELPEIFGKETSSNQHRDDRELPAIPTHKEWDGGTGHSGAKNVIVKSLNKNVKNIRRHMNRYFSGDSKIVADTMLTDSQAFLSELCNWVSRHHYELLTRTASDEGTVWKLVAHDVRVIFQLLFEARGPGRNTGEPQHFFWGTRRAYKVMQELRAHNFSGHPDLGHALNQHLQDNAVMKSSFYTLVKEVETLKRDVAEAKKTADKALSGKNAGGPEPIKGNLGNGLKAWTGGQLRGNGKLRIGVVTKGTPFWEWLIPRFGIHVWTWETGSKEDLKLKLEKEPVDIVLFDRADPSTANPVWNSPHVKCIMWEAWGRLDTQVIDDKGWIMSNTRIRA